MKPHRPRSLLAALALIALAVPTSALAASNGDLPQSTLSPIATGVHCAKPGGELANRAAAGFNTMALAAGKQLPINGCDSAYRSYARQVYYRNYWCSLGQCGNAAVPGTSNHGLGLAVDVPQWVRGYIDTTHGAFGFNKACSDAPQEWWHVKFCSGFSRPDPRNHLGSPRLLRGSGGPGQGPWVKKAQKLLRKHGAKHLKPDGQVGPLTCFAINQFKQAEHLKTSCTITQKVWRHLRAPVVKPPAPHPKPHPKPKPHHHGGHGHGNHGHHVGHKPPKGPVYGIDISQAQGSIDWKAVEQNRGPPISFAIAKATEGQDYKDPYFNASRLKAFRDAHIVPGVYHFLRPRSDRHGSREATWFVHVITQAGYGKGFLPPVIDVETTTLSPTATCHYVHSFYRRVKQTLHVHPIIYSFPSFVSSEFSGCKWIGKKRLWIANPGVSHPTVPAPFGGYLMWQYSFTGHVDGISGDVDLDKLPGGVKAIRKLQIQPAKKVSRPPKVKAPATTAAAPPPRELRARVPGASAKELRDEPAPEGQVSPEVEQLGLWAGLLFPQ